jgi:hypothetical protein
MGFWLLNIRNTVSDENAKFQGSQTGEFKVKCLSHLQGS